MQSNKEEPFEGDFHFDLAKTWLVRKYSPYMECPPFLKSFVLALVLSLVLTH